MRIQAATGPPELFGVQPPVMVATMWQLNVTAAEYQPATSCCSVAESH